MTLHELKTLLGIPPDDISKDALLEILLPAAIDFVIERTQNPFKKDENGEIILPAGVKLAISMMIQAVLAAGVGTEGGGDAGVVESERVGPMQQTFRNPAEIWTTGGGINGASGGSTAPWFALLKPYNRFRFIPAGSYKRDVLPCP
jgi:Phage QLRG family, putative DNA packaging.